MLKLIQILKKAIIFLKTLNLIYLYFILEQTIIFQLNTRSLQIISREKRSNSSGETQLIGRKNKNPEVRNLKHLLKQKS